MKRFPYIALNLLTQQQQQALDMALETLKHAYNPYSNFYVGAALIADDGQIISGTNFENAAYGSTICAERAAVLRANSMGIKKFNGIAIIGCGENLSDTSDITAPCGACRQVLFEISQNSNCDLAVIMSDTKKNKIVRTTIGELLPLGFGPNNLKKSTKSEEKSQIAQSSERFEGLQYHIGVEKGQLARYILLCGDPERAFKVAHYLKSIRTRAENREYVTFTGIYEGVELSVMATGIGTDNTEIAVIEASRCVEKPTFIRIGSCGAIVDGINMGDLVISSAALPRENTSSFYLPPDTKVAAHPDVLQALEEAARAQDFAYHTGLTCSTSSFYGGQGRDSKDFPIRDVAKRDYLFPLLSKEGVINFEMETSALFTLATISTLGLRAGSVCAVYAERLKNQGFAEEAKQRGESACIRTGLEAIRRLAERDAKSG